MPDEAVAPAAVALRGAADSGVKTKTPMAARARAEKISRAVDFFMEELRSMVGETNGVKERPEPFRKKLAPGMDPVPVVICEP